jgi:deoxyribodipyrimidine photo-lyase
MPEHRALVWFRRDLRIDDHAALAAATRRADRVWCAFVFDPDILAPLADRDDRRVDFIHRSAHELDAALRAHGGGLIVVHERPLSAIPRLARTLEVDEVHCGRDYEPFAAARDAAVERALREDGRSLHLHKDQVVFECEEVLTGAGKPFSVYTPYRNAWRKRLAPGDLAPHPVLLEGRLAPPPAGTTMPTLDSIGFRASALDAIGVRAGIEGGRERFAEFKERLGAYREARDYPAVRGPSYLSVHLRFGTVSVRTLARHARHVEQHDPGQAQGAATWLDELIWREFYFQVLHHHPHVVGHAFRPEYDRIRWADDDAAFAAWCEGRTGYPLVDAAIAQILKTGYMHNRLRMVVASFLVKDLGIDWRRGEAWFARHLIDFDLAANNGGWQWAASTGCDAQPWFRIFNPVTQSRRFDPRGRFIRRYLPQLANLDDAAIHAPWLASADTLARAGIRIGLEYPAPIVDHDQARKATLARYAVVRAS